jgi:two-component system sensor histidine kinase KdpD
MTADIQATPEPARVPPVLWGYLLVIPLCALAMTVAVSVQDFVARPSLALVLMLPVVILAVSFGAGPAMVCAAVGVVAFNFFLVEPRYSLTVADPSNVWALVLMFLVAVIVSLVAAQSRQRAIEAREHSGQAEGLQRLARALVAASDRASIARETAEALSAIFAAPAAVLLMEDARLVPTLAGATALTTEDMEAARWALASRQHTWAGAYPVDGSAYDFWPVVTRSRLQAVIGVQLTERIHGRPAALAHLMDIVAGYLEVALERDRYAAEALAREVELGSERIKADLLAAVSHDLRTPLSTILFTLQSLQRYGDTHDAATRADLLQLAETETARLGGLVANLLEMSRIEAGAMAVQCAPVAPADLVAAALDRVHLALGRHRIDNQLPHDAPLVMADSSLTETALANLLENAAKYSPAGSTITVCGGSVDGAMRIEVLDRGPGFPPDIETLFKKFTRGVEGDGRPPGTGLGLAIARGFLEAQGAHIRAANRIDGGGAAVTVLLPLAHEPAHSA